MFIAIEFTGDAVISRSDEIFVKTLEVARKHLKTFTRPEHDT